MCRMVAGSAPTAPVVTAGELTCPSIEVLHRAGDVPNNGPVIASATSTDLFALNHDTYARGKAINYDIGFLLRKGLHPPPKRMPIYEPPHRNGKTYWVFPRLPL
jgi:hypothetical protein